MARGQQQGLDGLASAPQPVAPFTGGLAPRHASYVVSLPLKPMPFREIHSAYAYKMSGPPVRVGRHFPSYEGEAVLYAALLAKRVQAGGVEALRQEARPASGQGREDSDPLTW